MRRSGAIIAALIAATAGKSLVNLPDAIRSGGSFDDGCPHLAAMVPDLSVVLRQPLRVWRRYLPG